LSKTLPLDVTFLREAAAAIEDREAAAAYVSDVQPSGTQRPPSLDYGVHLAWSWGKVHPGYEQVRSRVEKMVNAGLPAMMWQALKDIEEHERKALNAVRQVVTRG
jgi:hypothetical protein